VIPPVGIPAIGNRVDAGAVTASRSIVGEQAMMGSSKSFGLA